MGSGVNIPPRDESLTRYGNQNGGGRRSNVFCDDACRQPAYRRRRPGLDEDAYARGPGGQLDVSWTAQAPDFQA